MMKKVGILSLGLIGGSILKGLYELNKYSLYVCSSNQNTLNELKNYNSVMFSDNIKILKECDIVFVCSPINKTVENIIAVSKIVKSSCIICDVASLKGEIVEKCTNIPCEFISTHPMAGTEKQGFSNSFDTMFKNAKWVIIENVNQKDEDINLVKSVITDLGAKPIFADVISHDKACALISHAPALISETLVSVLLDEKDENIFNLAKELASTGFKDTTRLALSNKTMIRDMLDFNIDNIKNVLETFIKNSQKLLNDKEYFYSVIDNIIKLREDMYK